MIDLVRAAARKVGAVYVQLPVSLTRDSEVYWMSLYTRPPRPLYSAFRPTDQAPRRPSDCSTRVFPLFSPLCRSFLQPAPAMFPNSISNLKPYSPPSDFLNLSSTPRYSTFFAFWFSFSPGQEFRVPAPHKGPCQCISRLRQATDPPLKHVFFICPPQSQKRK